MLVTAAVASNRFGGRCYYSCGVIPNWRNWTKIFCRCIFERPKSSDISAGSADNALGQGQISGIAFIFDAQCGHVPFHVKGPLLDNGGVKHARLDSPSARVGLKRGRQPHWQALVDGKVHLGWQCRKGEPGRWVLRRYIGRSTSKSRSKKLGFRSKELGWSIGGA